MSSNDDVYAGGLLNRALDPSNQPPEIRAMMSAEIDLLQEVVTDGMRVIDLGCGTGRHLALLGDRLDIGVGVDYQCGYIAQARTSASAPNLHFVVGDGTAVPIDQEFDFAICLTNTWGTMSDKIGVLNEMRRLAPANETRMLSVYAESSVPIRREWYRRLGHEVLEEHPEYLMATGGFRSEHFSSARLRQLIGDCSIHPLAEIAHVVTF